MVHKNIFAVLTANETESLCIVEPLYCSLFHDLFLLNLMYAETRTLWLSDGWQYILSGIFFRALIGLDPRLVNSATLFAERYAERQQGCFRGTMLSANQIWLFAHGFPGTKRNIIHIEQPYLISVFAALAIDANGS